MSELTDETKRTTRALDQFSKTFAHRKRTRVVNVITARGGKGEATADIYIGRPSKWGNPFVVGRHGTRDQVVALYARWITKRIKQSPHLIEELLAMRGKTLGCFCAPQRCHGDVLVALIEGMTLLREQKQELGDVIVNTAGLTEEEISKALDSVLTTQTEAD